MRWEFMAQFSVLDNWQMDWFILVCQLPWTNYIWTQCLLDNAMNVILISVMFNCVYYYYYSVCRLF